MQWKENDSFLDRCWYTTDWNHTSSTLLVSQHGVTKENALNGGNFGALHHQAIRIEQQHWNFPQPNTIFPIQIFLFFVLYIMGEIAYVLVYLGCCFSQGFSLTGTAMIFHTIINFPIAQVLKRIIYKFRATTNKKENPWQTFSLTMLFFLGAYSM